MKPWTFATKVFGVLFLLGCIGLYLVVPSFKHVRQDFIASDSYFYDRSGDLIHVIRSDMNKRQFLWVESKNVAQTFINLLTTAEDQRFWYHPGIDPLGIVRSIVKSKRLGSQGASTLTMQLVARVLPSYHWIKPRSSILAKLWQGVAALALDLQWSKDEILSAYINLVGFRSELVGLPAAANLLFGKHPLALNRNESAILVAMLRSPNSSSTQLAKRACKLLNKVQAVKEDQTCLVQIEQLVNRALIRSFPRMSPPQLIPHFAKFVIDKLKAKQREIHTTIDSKTQRILIGSIANHIVDVRDQNAHDAAAIVIDNKTHQIVGYVGSSGAESFAPHIDGAQAFRQAGSTLKPFIYGKAIEQRLITAASVLDDSATEMLVAAGGVYRPSNFDERFRGPVTVRDALAGSLNIPAVRTVSLLGIDDAIATLVDFGFTNLRDTDYYGPSVALGAADVSLYDLVKAYHHLANFGSIHNLIFLSDQQQGTRLTKSALSREAAFIIRDILSDNVARARSFGLNSSLATSLNAAVKTGTSKDMRDNWCIGFTENYTVGVWVGNSNGSSMWNLTGVSGAAPIWAEVMHQLHEHSQVTPTSTSDFALEKKHISFSFKKGIVNEWFIKGTVPTDNNVINVERKYINSILYPTNQSILAFDHDIPARNQRLQFRSSRKDQYLVWELNGHDLGKTNEDVAWQVKRGTFKLALKDKSSGTLVDEVSFTVR